MIGPPNEIPGSATGFELTAFVSFGCDTDDRSCHSGRLDLNELTTQS
jgi:hypothetical protein